VDTLWLYVQWLRREAGATVGGKGTEE